MTLTQAFDLNGGDPFIFGRVTNKNVALLTLRFFLAGKIHDKGVSINLLLWSLGILMFIAASCIGFLNLPVLWALLGSIAMLAVTPSRFSFGSEGSSCPLRW